VISPLLTRSAMNIRTATSTKSTFPVDAPVS
jgi:hypothetical protein